MLHFHLSQFKLFYREKPPIEVNNQLIYKASSKKDVKAKIKKAWKFIAVLSIPLVVVSGQNNTYVIKPSI